MSLRLRFDLDFESIELNDEELKKVSWVTFYILEIRAN